MQNITLKVNGMSCQHCVNSVEEAIQEIGAHGQVDLKTKSVAVQYDDNLLTQETIKEAIEAQGYSVVQ